MTVDGITVANGYDGTQIGPLYSYIESFEEFRIEMANNTAEFGAIGQVTVVSKAGTNELHATGLDYYGTPMFRARDPFALQRPSGVSRSLGVAVSGPVALPKIYNGRNKTFFTFVFETSRGSQILQFLDPTMPLAPWRQGDFSALAPATIMRDPCLPATPIIDKVLVAADSAKETEYAPAPEGAGYRLRVREPGWHEHRIFKGTESDVNLHVFSMGSPEIDRMLTFRDCLRTNANDRELYARSKRALAQQDWKYTQNYADAKTAVIEEIISRAQKRARSND